MRRAIRGVLSEVGGSATRTIASGSRPSANTSPNCSTSRIVIPSSNSPFANFLLLGDRSAPGGRKRSIFSGVRSGSKRLCGKRANTRCRYPHGTSHTGRGNANALLPLPRCLVKLLAPVPVRAAFFSDPSPTYRALATSITCGPNFLVSLLGVVSVRSSGINHPTGPAGFRWSMQGGASLPAKPIHRDRQSSLQAVRLSLCSLLAR